MGPGAGDLPGDSGSFWVVRTEPLDDDRVCAQVFAGAFQMICVLRRILNGFGR